MQIHELNSRTPTATDEMALDTGSLTYKTTAGQLRPQFTSSDMANPTSWDDVPVLVGNNASITYVFERLTRMFRNIRYLWKLIGSNDFSNVAETISGAIGNTALTTTATDISGAIAEHEEDISTINGNLSKKFIETTGTSVDLTTAYAVVPCANVAANTNTEYLGTGSNGIVCKKSGRVLVELWARAINLTTADFVAIQFCVYRNGSLLFDSYSAVSSGKAIVSLSLNRQVRDVEAGDIICLRAQNQSGARGNLYPFRMNVEYL